MKKIVVTILIFCCLTFCSCTADTSGYSYELTSGKWYAKLEGGAEVKLEFADNNACFSISNADKKTEIKGKYIADESTFIIFVPEISMNYSFAYTPKGNTLDLTYDDDTITLKKTE